MEKDLYDLPPEEEKNIATVAHSLDLALDALDADRDFLKAGGVMGDDMIDAYIALKTEEVQRLRLATHPVEFEMYYSVYSGLVNTGLRGIVSLAPYAP